MGNYRYRFSNMMPNSWLYKVNDMGRTRNPYTSHSTEQKNQPKAKPKSQPHLFKLRPSVHFTPEPVPTDTFNNSLTNTKEPDTHFPDPPRRSSKSRGKKRTNIRPSGSISACCYATSDSACVQSDSTPEFSTPLEPEVRSDQFVGIVADDPYDGLASSSSCSCKVSSPTADIITKMDENSFSRKFEKLGALNTTSDIDLPPSLAKPTKFSAMVGGNKIKAVTKPAKDSSSSAKLDNTNANVSFSTVKVVNEESFKSPKELKTSNVTRRSPLNSPGVKLRLNSPRIASQKIRAYSRKNALSATSSRYQKKKNTSESFAIVKSSSDPQRDFRESMVEMIVENNIWASKDLEELLACYLYLNSSEHHDLIIKVFEQIWFYMSDMRFLIDNQNV